MFDAVITGPAGRPLRVCGALTPYDLECLREHVLARRGRATRVEVRLAPADRAMLLRTLGDLARFGVELVVAEPRIVPRA
jgi:hypothetical protein